MLTKFRIGVPLANRTVKWVTVHAENVEQARIEARKLLSRRGFRPLWFSEAA